MVRGDRPRRALGAILLAALAGPFVAGCGGDGDSDGPATYSVQATVIDSGFVANPGAATVASDLRVGDDVDNVTEYRAFARFSLAHFPPTTIVHSAQLQVVQLAVVNDPYTDFPPGVQVDHVVMENGLTAAEFGQAALSVVGTISTDATLAVKTLDVTAQVALDLLSGRRDSDFRLLFPGAPSVDGLADQARFHLINAAARAVLTVTYTIP